MDRKEIAYYKKGSFWTTLALISALILLVVYLNIGLARRTERIWIQSEGQLRLSNITSGVENNLARAENYAKSFATQFEFMLREEQAPQDGAIYAFIHDQNKLLAERTDGQCFSTYIAYRNRLYIENFVPDNSFHLSERVWYVGARKNQGKIYITAPYVDANTGNMCYSVSMLLEDGETIVGLDFYMDVIQDYIEKMNEQIEGISMIVNEGGMIVGHNDASLLGQDYTLLKDYRELIEKVFSLYGDYFEYTVHADETIKYTVFSDRTTYGWYLIVCLPSSEISSGAGASTLVVNIAIGLLWVIFVILFVWHYRRRYSLQQQLAVKEDVIRNISDRLRAPVTEISQQIRFADGAGDALLQNLRHLADELKENLDNISFFRGCSGTERDYQEEEEKNEKSGSKYKRYSATIIAVLMTASVISVAVNSYTQSAYIKAYMENESEVYYSQTKSWIDTNITLTNDLALHLGAQPELYQDYQKAVKYLDDVVKDNNDISVAYIVNPAWEHTVIMNNGWESDDPDWHVEERDWYVDTVLSERGFNISTPYRDEQTGMYCVTFSQIVYDEAGNIVGLIGIDFYMDTLIHILGESYTAEGYAFLTDPSYIILNHPSEAYQMSKEHSVNGAEKEYRDTLVSEKLTLMRDYDHKYMVTLAKREPRSGFTVVTVRKAWLIYGTLAATDVVLVTVFLISILSVLVITRYMTRRQEELNQELRVAAERAIEAGKAKSRFLAQMSHEIRTPINAVLGMNEMILREAKDDVILNYASNAYNAGNALLSIINDVLDISKIEAGKMEITEMEYDMYSLVSDCYHMTADRAAKKNLALSVFVEETLPAKLYGDMVHLRQIVVNFLTNAIKYTNEGSVELRFEGRTVNDGFALRVSVKDTGIGLSEESREKLFTSFQRFDLERNSSVEGTGLGLSICRQLTEMMGGTVDVESVYGKGSTFSCTIPQKIISDVPVGPFVPERCNGLQNMRKGRTFTAPKAHILVVDDVEMNLLVFTSLLKEHRFCIDTASSGKQCLKLVQKQRYDMIFMDHMMPEMDGVETYAHMKELQLNRETPVIMLTANAISGEKEKYLDAGFSAYLTKPVQSDRMEEVLLKYLPEELIVWKEEAKDGETAEEYSATENIDIKLGMHYTGGSEEAYFDILEKYVKDGENKQNSIRQFYEEASWKDYITLVHALKSTSLTIGARRLSEAAKELELAGKSEDYATVREKNDAMLELHRIVLEEGRALLGQRKGAEPDASDAAKEAEEITAEKLAEYVEGIRSAAGEFDSEQLAAFCKELSGCSFGGVSLRDGAGRIKEAVDEFEYEKAAETAKALYEELTKKLVP